jgi:hypothetical protein
MKPGWNKKKIIKSFDTKILQPEAFTLKSLYALIFIALRQIGCRVLFTDLIR